MPTEIECKRLISRVGLKTGVSPRLISTRLLSAEDKVDMLNGTLEDRTLLTAVEVWKAARLPDYAQGFREELKDWYRYV